MNKVTLDGQVAMEEMMSLAMERHSIQNVVFICTLVFIKDSTGTLRLFNLVFKMFSPVLALGLYHLIRLINLVIVVVVGAVD